MQVVIIISVILVLAFFLKKKSRSEFFKQDEFILDVYRDKLIQLLKIKNRTEADISHYVKAFDFFCRYTTKYDGATFVKDLYDIPKLDADSMVHDYDCLVGANRNYKKWFKSAWVYYENMRINGKGNRPFRLVGLCLIGFFYVPYCYFFTPLYKD